MSGRVFFEQVIRDNLGVGRPDQVGLIFGRRMVRSGPRATPGRFRTRVITGGVTPSLHVDYKNAKIKQYHKEGRALRTETTINDTRDFGIGKRLTNLPALREVGFTATRRLLGASKTQPRPDHRSRRPGPDHRPGPHRRPAPASPGCASASPALTALLPVLLHLPPAPPRLHQRRPARPPGTTARRKSPTS